MQIEITVEKTERERRGERLKRYQKELGERMDGRKGGEGSGHGVPVCEKSGGTT